jgi:hypothetical protein
VLKHLKKWKRIDSIFVCYYKKRKRNKSVTIFNSKKLFGGQSPIFEEGQTGEKNANPGERRRTLLLDKALRKIHLPVLDSDEWE